MDDFQLIETMRVSERGEVCLLDRHLNRLSKSASYFSFQCNLDQLRAQIRQALPAAGNPLSLRLVLSKNGDSIVQVRPLPPDYARRLKLSRRRVHSTDLFLYHKTTNRVLYEEARQECDQQTDAILSNERGEVTESTIMNVAVFRQDRWVTPRISCGLLPGVMREEMLALGEIVEGVVRVEELQDGELIRCFNALRGVTDVPYAED